MPSRVTICLLVLLAGACTRPVTLESRWQPGAKPAAPYSKVLVVALSEDYERRRLFENALADALAASGVTALTSTRSMKTTDVLSRDSVGALVRADGAQAVVVTRLVDQQVGVKEQPGREVVNVPGPEDTMRDLDQYAWNVYRYDFNVSQEPSSLVLKRRAETATDLFETREGKLVYTIRSSLRFKTSAAVDQNTDLAVIDQLAAALAKQLRRDGAVR